MINKAKSLPNWFDWNDYKTLAEIDDISKWAYLFAVRDTAYKAERQKGLGAYRNADPKTPEEEIPWLMWRNGVLSNGVKGHDTHYHLNRVIKHAARNAIFVPEDKFQKLQKSGRLVKGNFYALNGIIKHIFQQEGRLQFESKEAFEEYRTIENAMFGGTVELAFNVFTPKETILKEIGRVIDEAQHSFLMEIKRKKVSRETPLTWSRGLACWDLENKKITRYKIAQYLAPLWRNDSLGEGPPNDQDKKDVRDAINAVKPFINGGWKALSGDPIATISSDFSLGTELLERKPKHRG